ncbi:MAG: type II toxin-antitoxin system VapC family toxin [Deltaproteobacteria bacterium]|nr:type II toxin-antitoxin system VapC family toxin [Deltaproteobacteria bacterium]
MKMKKYILDSNIVSYLYDPKSPFCQAVQKKVETVSDRDEITTSILTVYEHRYGIAKADNLDDADLVAKVIRTYDMMIDSFSLIPLSVKAAEEFGKLKNEYRKKIEQTGIKKKELKNKLRGDTVDLILAASAIAEGAILVSNDKIFEEIREMRPNFLMEDWTK